MKVIREQYTKELRAETWGTREVQTKVQEKETYELIYLSSRQESLSSEERKDKKKYQRQRRVP